MGERIFVCVLAALTALAAGCADPEKDRKIAELEKQMGELEQMVADLEQQAAAIKADAERAPAAGSQCGAELAACRERLVTCEQDPFKGGKYFVADENAKGEAAGAGPEVKDPFAKAQPASAPAGEVKDPFKQGD